MSALEQMTADDFWDGADAEGLDLSADSTEADMAHAAREWTEEARADGVELTGAVEFARLLVSVAQDEESNA